MAKTRNLKKRRQRDRERYAKRIRKAASRLEKRSEQQIEDCEIRYRELIRDGWRPQEARSVFPNALATKILATMNLRTWRHIFMMRTTKEAHPQMRQVMITLLREFQARIPVFYDDIEPDRSQAESIARAR